MLPVPLLCQEQFKTCLLVATQERLLLVLFFLSCWLCCASKSASCPACVLVCSCLQCVLHTVNARYLNPPQTGKDHPTKQPRLAKLPTIHCQCILLLGLLPHVVLVLRSFPRLLHSLSSMLCVSIAMYARGPVGYALYPSIQVLLNFLSSARFVDVSKLLLFPLPAIYVHFQTFLLSIFLREIESLMSWYT